jgi:bacteriorhodopsin
MMLYISGVISLLIQLIVGLIDFWGLTINVPEDKNIFKDLLKLELGVQIVEFTFYAWMVFNFKNITNITPYRYFDWFLTTPTMLITLMAFLSKNNFNNLSDFIKSNKKNIIIVGLANALMLLFGLLGEFNVINYTTGVLLGFIPFFYYYKKIYDEYINKDSNKDQKGLFWFFFIVWSLYGLAALFPYSIKNSMYNTLDLFSKNLLGLILVYVIWKNRT